MNWGFQKKMLTVRELFGRMRTHSVACTVAAAGLAAIVCGVIVFRAIGGIVFGDVSVSSRDDEILEMMEQDDAILMEQNDAMRLQLDTMFVSLQSLRENVNNGTQVIETIERSLSEMNGADESTKRRFRETSDAMAELEKMMAEAFGEMTEISALLDDGALSDDPSREALSVRMGNLSAAMAKIVDKYASLSTGVSTLAFRLRSLGAGATEFSHAVDVLQESIAGGRTEMDELSAQLGEMGIHISDAQDRMLERLNVSIDSVERLSDQVSASNLTVGNLSEQVVASAQAVGHLSEQLDASTQTIGQLCTQLSETKAELDELRNSVTAANTSMENAAVQFAEQSKHTAQLHQRGDGYMTVSFSFGLSINDTSYTFDLSPYVSNHAALTGSDILVKNFSVYTTGKSPYYIGVGANLNMDHAVYDPSTGRLSVTQKLQVSPFGSQSGSVTFAVIGGMPYAPEEEGTAEEAAPAETATGEAAPSEAAPAEDAESGTP